MRMGRPVGLSQDGRSLIIATSGGEELAVPVDDRLHAALRGDRPRLGQLEMEMEDALSPRDIQARIRSGQTLDEVARIAGLPFDRVERFAAPVLAERQHIATLAMTSSVRRRGETSAHRNLRVALTEKLGKRGIDIDTIDWDSYRLEDGRWSVSAAYQSGEARRQAVFVFDLRARFSVADNDEARWALGEQSPAKGPQPGRRRPTGQGGEGGPDTEPTLDLSDELALVRVVQPPQAVEPIADLDEEQPAEPPDDAGTGQSAGELAEVRDLYPVPDLPDADGSDPDPLSVAVASERGRSRGSSSKDDEDEDDQDASDIAVSEVVGEDQSSADDDTSTRPESRSRLSTRGLSDASAVPQTADWAWEPAVAVDFPVEPSPDGELTADTAAVPDDHRPAGTAPEVSPGEVPAHEPHLDGPDSPKPADSPAQVEDEAAPVPSEAEEPAALEPAGRQPTKRKRAAVPSWDEIMFGGPKRS